MEAPNALRGSKRYVTAANPAAADPTGPRKTTDANPNTERTNMRPDDETFLAKQRGYNSPLTLPCPPIRGVDWIGGHDEEEHDEQE